MVWRWVWFPETEGAVISVFDVAAYVLEKLGPMTAMKMHKLAYYAQAWSVVWDDEPLIDGRFEAWANGPVSPEYFAAHRGEYTVSSEPRGNVKLIKGRVKATVDAVIKAYGDKEPGWLSDLTHREDPWIKAREGLSPGQRGNQEISLASMRDYYSSL